MTTAIANDIKLLDLVTSLGQFPRNVLPEAVFREITAIGPAANKVLLSRLERAAENANGGIGSIPSESFFCFALLHAHPDVGMLPAIKRIYELDEDAFEEIVGDLMHVFSTSLIARMTDADNLGVVRDWIDSMLMNPKVNEFARWNLVNVVRQWAAAGLLSREAAIEQLKSWLLQRAGETQDMLSGACVLELLHLRAAEERDFIEECFLRSQIDETLIDLDSSLDVLSSGKNSGNDLPDDLKENNLIEYFRSWAGYTKASESLNPRETKFIDIQDDGYRFSDKPMPDVYDGWFDAIRQSNDQDYPRDAVAKLIRHSSEQIDRLVDEVRWGLQQAVGPTPRESNGPFIAATILTAEEFVPASDEFLGILDLPPDQRMDLFGDAMEPSIVAALSSTLLGDCDPIDQRIDDASRDAVDRAELAMFYPLSVWRGCLSRERCILRLTDLLERNINAATPLPDAIYDALCLMSVGEDEPIIRRARENGIQNFLISETTARDCIEQPSGAKKVIWDIAREFWSPQQAIESSVMFDSDVINPPPIARHLQTAPPSSMSDNSSATVVSDADDRIPRNAPCVCGSGKKYKKCCGRR